MHAASRHGTPSLTSLPKDDGRRTKDEGQRTVEGRRKSHRSNNDIELNHTAPTQLRISRGTFHNGVKH